MLENKYIKKYSEVGIRDISLVGGKNASLGEMYQSLKPLGVHIPDGFIVTADAFTSFLKEKNIADKIYDMLSELDINNISELSQKGQDIRELIRSQDLPLDLKTDLRNAYASLGHFLGRENVDVAVRSSATAEDLPGASFAGQQETFLNVQGEASLFHACINCFASLFTDRAISYRVNNGFDHRKVSLSIGIQQMVRSDLASSGVIFTLDTETGARNVVLVTSSYGLGENIVGGRVDPDEFLVLKDLVGKSDYPIIRKKMGLKQMRMTYSHHGSQRTKNIEVSKAERENYSITNEDILILSQWALQIEAYYSELNHHETPMDIEWAKDGETGALYILQARPETVHSLVDIYDDQVMSLTEKSKIILKGKAVGTKIGSGKTRIITDVRQLSSFVEGEILVSDMTDPDWEPVMKKASAVITNRGGRTCHAAIVSREIGVPCIVGSGIATSVLSNGREVTVSCAEGEEGLVFEGKLAFKTESLSWKKSYNLKTQILVNVGNPDMAFKSAMLPVDGVGLARLEFIIAEHVQIHPMALIHPAKVSNEESIKIKNLIKGFENDPTSYFVEKLAEGMSMIAGAFWPRPVIVRMSDFKTNEYAHLIGGKNFEPTEENPMIGFRGACRYYSPQYREGFALECRAIKFVREKIGLTNIKVMIPFCRTAKEGSMVIQEMAKNGLVQSSDGLQIYVMCELPSNVMDFESFARIFDGFSIGSNDLTQMTLGVDRDSDLLSDLFDERNQAVLEMFSIAIQKAKKMKKYIGICGQAPSDYPEIARLLVKMGIDSISLSHDSVLSSMDRIWEVEKESSDKSLNL